uniref:Uncharacterized protein n=1 Tax=Plectus sambesii TaxID=2011161 RepID=A0A914UM54_9BILA
MRTVRKILRLSFGLKGTRPYSGEETGCSIDFDTAGTAFRGSLEGGELGESMILSDIFIALFASKEHIGCMTGGKLKKSGDCRKQMFSWNDPEIITVKRT